MRNVPASVRQRLLNLSRAQQRPFQEILQFYVMERFLYRLSQSPEADCFVLKGALMLQVWQAPQSRPTMDIDMLGRIDNDPVALLECMRAVLRADSIDDGLRFDSDTLQAERITEDADYQGVRIRGKVWLETLAGAIRATFERRNTRLPSLPLFTEDFAAEKQPQWDAFLRQPGARVGGA